MVPLVWPIAKWSLPSQNQGLLGSWEKKLEIQEATKTRKRVKGCDRKWHGAQLILRCNSKWNISVQKRLLTDDKSMENTRKCRKIWLIIVQSHANSAKDKGISTLKYIQNHPEAERNQFHSHFASINSNIFHASLEPVPRCRGAPVPVVVSAGSSVRSPWNSVAPGCTSPESLAERSASRRSCRLELQSGAEQLR